MKTVPTPFARLGLAGMMLLLTIAGAQGAPNGLISHWSFDNSGNPGHDDHGSNHGTVDGATWISGGMVGGALSFDGSNDVVTIPDSPSLDLAHGLSIALWVRASVLPKSGHQYGILTKGINYADPSVNFLLRMAGGGNVSCWPGDVTSVSSLADDAWRFVAMTWDGYDVRLYVDGEQEGSGICGTPLTANDKPLLLGWAYGWTDRYKGQLDEVAVFSRGLTPAEVWAMYRTRGYDGPAPEAGLGMFEAYNDLAWYGGQTAQNITTYTVPGGIPGLLERGALLDYATGWPTPLALEITGGDAAHQDQGLHPAAGTDAHAVFDGTVDCAGTIGYATEDLKLKLSGLDPGMRYEVVLYSDRANPAYTNGSSRYHEATLSGAEAFVNASSAGVTVSSRAAPSDTTVYNAGYNTPFGYVTRFAGIDAGYGGQIEIVLARDVAESRYTYANALMVKGVGADIRRGSAWRYRRGTAEASAPVAAWRARDYDDGDWEAGRAPFGYAGVGDPEHPFGTEFPEMRYAYNSLFLRRAFWVDEPGATTGLVLRVNYDDGFVAWINGTEVQRVGLPAGEVHCTDVAASHESGVFESFALPAPAGYLVPGYNVLCLQGFNADSGSSDFKLDAELEVAVRRAAPPLVAPAGGANRTSITVTLRAVDPGAVVHYTLDGIRPTTNSTVYSGPLVLNQSAAVRAIAAGPGYAPSEPAAADFTVVACNRFYVDKDAPGPTRNGASWATAFLKVQQGVNAASTNDEVWVAEGTYVENVVMHQDIALYGGFDGTETALAERDWTAHETILDGSLTGTVVTVTGAVSRLSRIDGFTIRNGTQGIVASEDGSPVIRNNLIAGNGNAEASGGGISIYGWCRPLIEHNTIVSNTARYGGGVYTSYGDSEIYSNTIAWNVAVEHGGGISSHGRVVGNRIVGNVSWRNGGGIEGQSPEILNNVIADNVASNYGGGLYFDYGEFLYGQVANNIITSNRALQGGAMYDYHTTLFAMNNTVLWNTASNDAGFYFGRDWVSWMYTNVWANNIFAWNDSTEPSADRKFFLNNCIWSNANFVPAEGAGYIQQDPLFVDAAGGDFHLRTNSPCRDAGWTAPVRQHWQDHDGGPRILGASVDIGAYEQSGTPWTLAPAQGRWRYFEAVGRPATTASGWLAPEFDDGNWAHLAGAPFGYAAPGGHEHPFGLNLMQDYPYFWMSNRYSTLYLRQRFDLPNPACVSNLTLHVNYDDGFVAWINGHEIARANVAPGPTEWNQTALGSHESGTWEAFTVPAADVQACLLPGENVIAVHAMNAAIADDDFKIDVELTCELAAGSQPAATPQFAPNGGTFTNSVAVTLLAATPGATIFWTTDLTDPTDQTYLGKGLTPVALTLTNSTTLKARAYAAGYEPSEVASASFTVGPPAPDNVVYVKHDAPGPAHDGSTWATACLTVGAGLSAAAVSDEVWVARGTYVGCLTVPDYVALYGGFGGVETARAARNWNANPTVLDGNATGTVVRLGTWSRVDGFTIRNGRGADGGGVDTGARHGTVANNIIVGNQATANGGGVCIDFGENASPPPDDPPCAAPGPTGAGPTADAAVEGAYLINNLIISNTAPQGGGVYGFHAYDAEIVNNTIVHNSATDGGGMYFVRNAWVANNIVAFNTSGIYGPGRLYHCCVHGNTDYDFAGCSTGYNPVLADPLFADRPSTNLRLQAFSPCIGTGDDSWIGPDWLDMDGGPRLIPSHVDIGAYEFVAAQQVAAPVLNPPSAGFRTSVSVTITTATSGASIYYTTDGSTPTPLSTAYGGAFTVSETLAVRARAYRAGFTPSTVSTGRFWQVVFVSHDAPGPTHDGASWQTAHTTVAAGLATAGSNQSVWVKAGVYAENVTVPADVALYGGFGGTETSLEQRDPRAYPTILDGGGTGTVVRIGYRTEGLTRVDGFVIRNGNASEGGGVYAGDGRPIIANNVVTNNTAGLGAGIGSGGCQAQILNNTIAHNTASGSGGGIGSDGGGGEGPFVYGNRIHDNTAGQGAGMYVRHNEPRIVNNTIVANTSVGGQGGGLYCAYANNAPLAANNIIAFNNSGVYGGFAARCNCVYGNTNYDYSGTTPDTNSLSADPLFVNFAARDLHLQEESPCIDAGDSSVAPADSTDLDGNSRVVDGTVDMGCYEHQGSAPQTVAAPSVTPNGGTFTNSVAVTLNTTTAGATLCCNLDPPDPSDPTVQSCWTSAVGSLTFTLTNSATLKARAYLAGYTPSEVAGAAFTIAAGATVPMAPTNLTATAVATNRIDLGWQDRSTDETRFKIDRRLLGATTWTRIAEPIANTTNYSDATVTPGTTYVYRVKAYNAAGNSDYSNDAPATTPATGGPAAPSGLTGVALSFARVALSWQANSTDQTAFQIEKSKSEPVYWRAAAAVGSNVTAYTDTEVEAGTTYLYRVRALRGAEVSDWSDVVAVPVPARGTGLTAYNDLAWFAGQTNNHITTHTSGQSGPLVDYATGGDVSGVGCQVSGGSVGTVYESQGSDAAAGTDAAATFSGKVDCRSLISYGTGSVPITVELTGLDPSLRYEAALFCNRNQAYTPIRQAAVTISGADAFENTSTPGAAVSTTTASNDTTTVNVDNTLHGYVARFANIDPGLDGALTVAVDSPDGHPYANAFRLDGAVPGYLWHVRTQNDLHVISTPDWSRADMRRATLYTCPASADTNLLPAVYQNANVYSLHVEFLRQAFPERFAGLTMEQYTAMVLYRATRSYYSGVIYEFWTPELGSFYGFNVTTDPGNQDELPSPAEVQVVYNFVAASLDLRPLYYAPTDYMEKENTRNWTSPPFPVYLPEGLAQPTYTPYTMAVNYGTVKRLTLAQLDQALADMTLSWQDIVVLDQAPFDLETIVAGVITAQEQTDLSHINIRCARRGTPNAFVANALDEFAAYEGQLVRLEVGQTNYTVEIETDPAAAQAWWDTHRPSLSRPPPQPDWSVTNFLGLTEGEATNAAVSALVHTYGGKTANLMAGNRHMAFEYQVAGFGIPFV
ncbi:MAG: chitobiase/beta-hexosaminidase C-terminal domain-containing protein, partial [Kiritimatiellae bacterium]|nr:chitobiase/beta-hexosaminidase C-terminal domain-containing protein [Kiritimatiellia bacterium]